jgi:hypothetical protein
MAPIAVQAQTDTEGDKPSSYPAHVARVLDVCPSVKLSSFDFTQGLNNRTYSAHWGNVSEKPVVAFELRVLRFNAFDEPLADFVHCVPGHNSGDFSPLEKGQTDDDAYGDKADADLFTALAYVSKVRFADGSVWRAAPSVIETEKQKALPSLGRPAPMLRKTG